MLDWISDTVWGIVTYVPALIVDQDSPTFEAVRAMFGLLLIMAVVYIIAMMPRFGFAQSIRKKMSDRFGRKTD
jgi:hypothetical protein